MPRTSQKERIDKLEREVEELKQIIQQLINEKHNERGAGRKERFTENQKQDIKRLRQEGNTISEIAKIYKCSVGLIHKLINEQGERKIIEGTLAYNHENGLYGVLYFDLWELTGLHNGDALEVKISDIWVNTRIELTEDGKWCLADTGMIGDDLEGLKVKVSK